MERLQAFLPSILIIAAIAGGALLYVKWISKRYNVKNIEWAEEDQRKVELIKDFVVFPIITTLTFFAPPIIIFSTLSSAAWYSVLTIGGLMALLNWLVMRNFSAKVKTALETEKADNQKSFGEQFEIYRMEKSFNKLTTWWKTSIIVLYILFMFIAAGYYGIVSQSIWVALGIFIVCNVVMQNMHVLFVSLPYLVAKKN